MLATIFLFIPRHEVQWTSPGLVACSAVSRGWTVEARRALYEKVTLFNLVGLLGDMMYTSENGWVSDFSLCLPIQSICLHDIQVFNATFDALNRTKFFETARVVKFLAHVERTPMMVESPSGSPVDGGLDPDLHVPADDLPLFDSVYDVLAGLRVTRPSDHGDHLFPNLTQLDWSFSKGISALEVLPFLSPKIRHLSIRFENEDNPDNVAALMSLFEDMERTPNLQPQTLMLGLDTEPGQPQTRELSERVRHWIEEQGNLLALVLTGVNCQRPDRTLLGHPGLRIFTGTLEYASYDDLQDLITSFVAECPHVETLTLTLIRSQQGQIPDTPLPFHNILSPLLDLSSLTSLSIHDDMPCILNPADIVNMGRSWSSLNTLSLCGNPQPEYTFTGNPMNCLDMFATAFRDTLVKLELLIDFNRAWELGADNWIEEEAAFRHPFELLVGPSLPPKYREDLQYMVGIFGGIFPEGLSLGWSDFAGFPNGKAHRLAWELIGSGLEYDEAFAQSESQEEPKDWTLNWSAATSNS